jgi:DNA repair protein RadC
MTIHERIANYGVNCISDNEAIILATNLTPEKLAPIIENHPIEQLCRLTISELVSIYGLTDKQAKRFVCAFALAKRINVVQPKKKITQSTHIADMYSYLIHEEREIFNIVFLNRNNQVIRSVEHTKGTEVGTSVDAKHIIKEAILTKGCQAVILVHNHPSGSIHPSTADRDLTHKIKSGLKLMDINLLDHVIMANGGTTKHYSFADEGIL